MTLKALPGARPRESLPRSFHSLPPSAPTRLRLLQVSSQRETPPRSNDKRMLLMKEIPRLLLCYDLVSDVCPSQAASSASPFIATFRSGRLLPLGVGLRGPIRTRWRVAPAPQNGLRRHGQPLTFARCGAWSSPAIKDVARRQGLSWWRCAYRSERQACGSSAKISNINSDHGAKREVKTARFEYDNLHARTQTKSKHNRVLACIVSSFRLSPQSKSTRESLLYRSCERSALRSTPPMKPPARWCAYLLTFSKYSSLPLGSVLIVALSGSQLAGQTSPCSSVNWKALMSLMVSSTERPTGRSLMVIWRSVPLGSIRNRPRRATPASSIRTS